jgi:hypothetical protein
MQPVEIRGNTRIVFAGSAHFGKKSFGHDLMRLERELKHRLEPRLELTLESLEDRNKREARTKRAEK